MKARVTYEHLYFSELVLKLVLLADIFQIDPICLIFEMPIEILELKHHFFG